MFFCSLVHEEVKILERDIERALIKAVRKRGGLCLKFVSPGWIGAPDRICLFPQGRLIFIEVKRPGGKVRPIQAKRHEDLKSLGFDVRVIDGKEKIEDAITLISEASS